MVLVALVINRHQVHISRGLERRIKKMKGGVKVFRITAVIDWLNV